MNGNLSQDEKNRIFMTLDAQTKILERLERGMYGDKENGVKGVLKDVAEIKKWIAASKVKIAFISGIGATVGFFSAKAWEWLVSHK